MADAYCSDGDDEHSHDEEDSWSQEDDTEDLSEQIMKVRGYVRELLGRHEVDEVFCLGSDNSDNE